MRDIFFLNFLFWNFQKHSCLKTSSGCTLYVDATVVNVLLCCLLLHLLFLRLYTPVLLLNHGQAGCTLQDACPLNIPAWIFFYYTGLLDFKTTVFPIQEKKTKTELSWTTYGLNNLYREVWHEKSELECSGGALSEPGPENLVCGCQSAQ